MITTDTISQDLRVRIIKSVEKGMSARAAAKKFEVSASFATKLLKQWRETKSSKPLRLGGYKPFLLKPHQDLLCEIIETNPDWTLQEINSYLNQEHDINVHLTTVSRFLHHLGYTYKKKRYLPPNKIEKM